MKTKVLQAFFIFALVGGICNAAYAYPSTRGACAAENGEFEKDENSLVTPEDRDLEPGECTSQTENTVG